LRCFGRATRHVFTVFPGRFHVQLHSVI
jgi:hypothetical protein